MWIIILTAAYFFIGGLLAAALLTDKNVNTNRLEAGFCVAAGLLWPLAVGTAAGFAFYENIREKIEIKRQARNEQVRRFCVKLHKMRLISKETLASLQKK